MAENIVEKSGYGPVEDLEEDSDDVKPSVNAYTILVSIITGALLSYVTKVRPLEKELAEKQAEVAILKGALDKSSQDKAELKILLDSATYQARNNSVGSGLTESDIAPYFHQLYAMLSSQGKETQALIANSAESLSQMVEKKNENWKDMLGPLVEKVLIIDEKLDSVQNTGEDILSKMKRH